MNKSLLAAAMLIAFPLAAETQNELFEQITVTGKRVPSTSLENTQSIGVINADQLDLIKHEHVNQSLTRIAGAWVSRGNGQEHLTALRSPVLTGAGGCGAFFMAQDGISLRAPGFCNANQLFDANTEQAAQIEVLKGPASTLYGSNAVHGVINVLTPSPADGVQPLIELTGGPHDYINGQFVAGVSGEEHSFALYGNGTTDGGYKDDSGFDQQKLNFIHQYQADNWSIKSVVSGSNLNQETAGFITGFEAYKDESLKKDNPNPEAFRDSESLRAYSQILYQVADNQSLQVTPYFRSTEMTFLQHFLPWKALEENEQQSVGVQAQYVIQQDSLNWLVGLDIDVTEGKLRETQAEPFSATIPAGEHYDYEVDATVYSPFAKVEWLANEQLTLTAGLRYDATEYDYNNNLTDGSACAPEVENCRFMRPSDQTVDYDEVSYQLGANFRLDDNLGFFGQWSTGYRAPQATELFRLQAGQQVADLDAENIESLELGIRGSSNTQFFEVSAFAMEKENFIFQDANRQNISDGETTHYGVEFSVHQSLPTNFYVTVNGTIANHRYDSELTLSRENIKGNEIDTAPQHMGSAQLGWNNKNGQQVELEWVHMGNYYINPENTAKYEGHDLFNLRASYDVTPQLRASVRVLNITDKDYAERADFGFGSYRYFVGEPRSVFVSVRYLFD
ncbi:TonB-dependent receptor [Thalassotalea euphylliae]|uniref:TonB-dependent receptor n=1 Tax=Thalassotalea euphylliae TaxID=1655234 RepID=UPI00363F991E